MKSRRLMWVGHVAKLEEGRYSKSTGKRSLGRPRRRWEENTIIDLKEIGFNTRNCIGSAQDRIYFRDTVAAELNP